MFESKGLSSLKTKSCDVVEINIEIKDIEDILKDSESAAPIEESLSKTIEEYLFKTIKFYPVKQKIKLLIIINGIIKQQDKEKVAEIIHSHFNYKEKETKIYLKEQVRQWRINFLIGMLFLILCLILAEVLNEFSYIGMIKIAKESLLIIGWVALWEPVNFILFGWRTIKRDRLHCRKLSNIPVEVVEKRRIFYECN